MVVPSGPPQALRPGSIEPTTRPARGGTQNRTAPERLTPMVEAAKTVLWETGRWKSRVTSMNSLPRKPRAGERTSIP